MRRAKSDYVIQAVVNALRVLEAFRDRDELGVSEIARRLNLQKNNVFRLLATLQESGYVQQSPESERYRLGPRCVELGEAFVRANALLQRARPVIADLVRRTRETVHLGVLDGFEVLHLDGELSPHMLGAQLRVGRRLPSHCTALGKILLASAPVELWEEFDRRVIGSRGLERRTPATIVDREKLLEQLRAAAARGWALDLEECERDVACAAAPVYDARGRVCAALSVSGPLSRIDPATLESELVPALLEAAGRLSRELGARL